MVRGQHQPHVNSQKIREAEGGDPRALPIIIPLRLPKPTEKGQFSILSSRFTIGCLQNVSPQRGNECKYDELEVNRAALISALSGMRGIRLSWPRLQTDVAHGAKEQLKEQNVNPWLRPELNLNSLSLLGDRWRLVDLEDPVKSQKKNKN